MYASLYGVHQQTPSNAQAWCETGDKPKDAEKGRGQRKRQKMIEVTQRQRQTHSLTQDMSEKPDLETK